MDNFSGRGTTALVARENNRIFVGNDLNPYAYVLTRFKLSHVKKQDLIDLVLQWKQEWNKSSIKRDKQFDINKYTKEYLLNIYSLKTLKQLIFIRNKYGKKWDKLDDSQNAIIAFMLGLMHGQMRNNGATNYFSLSMLNTISMSPNYVKKYATINKLIKPDVDIFQQTINRINAKYDQILEKDYNSQFHLHDSCQEFKWIDPNYVDLVITSPPYLNIVNYTTSNWLKLWLLGYEKEELRKINLSDKFSYNKYVKFIQDYLNNIYLLLKNKAKVCIVVGDIFDKNLIESVWKEIENNVKYKFVEIYYNDYPQNVKVNNALNSKKAKLLKSIKY